MASLPKKAAKKFFHYVISDWFVHYINSKLNGLAKVAESKNPEAAHFDDATIVMIDNVYGEGKPKAWTIGWAMSQVDEDTTDEDAPVEAPALTLEDLKTDPAVKKIIEASNDLVARINGEFVLMRDKVSRGGGWKEDLVRLQQEFDHPYYDSERGAFLTKSEHAVKHERQSGMKKV